MKSYSYNQGQFDLINDPIALIKDWPGDYAFKKALASLGFGTFPEGQTFKCKAGNLRVYARDHLALDKQRKPKELGYDFLCLLYLGESYIRIWIADVPNMLLFLEEVHAQPEDRNNLEQFLKESDLESLVTYLNLTAQALFNGDLEIIVKPPKPR